ncbi:ATP12 family chaperone protein [Aurantiacibacter sp. D1-12]|uniref:ATP12 family chaperone protein n=1 Tax=Aurantiacibacter sp. D1-12 TaxID=2993658 RepID=UPI00237CE377|nr:ATP12 family protein [Aurantiacibacter sp. D1-12]MDE1467044.1 molecular chaperone [Aurantiacibacter sp. D1-12]
MKKFWKEVSIAEVEGGWQVTLDGRGIKTQRGAAQVVPTQEAAELLAEEWRAQGDEIDTKVFVFRDLADFAIDMVRPDIGGTVDKLLSYADTDTLCYRASPDEPLYQRQEEVWEPLVTAFEKRHGARMERVSGVVHRGHPEATMAALRDRLVGEDDFTLSALITLASLAASIVVALAILDEDGDTSTMFAAANVEEDWQAELWGWDAEAERTRKLQLEAFEKAAQFAKAVRD